MKEQKLDDKEIKRLFEAWNRMLSSTNSYMTCLAGRVEKIEHALNSFIRKYSEEE